MGNFTLKIPRKTSPDHRSQMNPILGDTGRYEDRGLTLAPEDSFRKVLSIERKRSERSRQRFVLMLVHVGELLEAEREESILGAITKVLSSSIRETDLPGWYKEDWVVGVICTEIGSGSIESIISALNGRVSSAMRTNLHLEQMNMIHVSFHVFPDDLDLKNGGRPADIRLYPDLRPEDNATRASRVVKRTIDIMGSLFALVLLSPLLIVIAAVIKLTSKGPILFRQQRVGQYGAHFTFLKFRSMYFQSDAKIHRDYVRQLITAKENHQQPDNSRGVYKIKNDPRVTPVGRFLRKTSLDELPQFFNVLDRRDVPGRTATPYSV